MSPQLPDKEDLSVECGVQQSPSACKTVSTLPSQPILTEVKGTINSKKRKHDIVEMLECPICLDCPRKGPIFNCSNGHVVCSVCLPKTNLCPVCRCTKVDCRNLIAEKLLEEALSDRVVSCRLSSSGCTFQALLARVVQHEALCVYRAVPCPARHRGACTWTGPLHSLVKHVVGQRCVQIVKMNPEKRTYSSVIGNFNQDDLTVFDRPNMTHWKPVMLVSAEHMRLFAYLVMYRTQKGDWMVYVRGYAGREALDKWKAKVTVRRPPPPPPTPQEATEEVKVENNNNFEQGPMWVFEGDIISHEATEKDVQESGQFLSLGDAQVKRMVVDRTLFEYVVEISEKSSVNNPGAV